MLVLFAGTDRIIAFQSVIVEFSHRYLVLQLGGYIVFNSSIPEELLNGGSHTVASHFKLVNYQVMEYHVDSFIAPVS
jgi:hypothetical protein